MDGINKTIEETKIFLNKMHEAERKGTIYNDDNWNTLESEGTQLIQKLEKTLELEMELKIRSSIIKLIKIIKGFFAPFIEDEDEDI
jgi:hypothetical protein